MEFRIETISVKKLVGKRIIMSLSDNRTGELWYSFMSGKKDIKNNIGSDLYSIQVYEPFYFNDFNPATKFEKWAAIEVTDFHSVPDEMETIILTGGLYTVFLHKGGQGTGPGTFQNIFGMWLPNSDYTLDNRPHFELLGEKYKNEDPLSEEEIWIPVRPKKQS